MWLRLAAAAALLGMAGSAVGLLAPAAVYGRETPDLVNAAIAQDLVNLFLVGPLILVLAVRASRGSLRSRPCLIGFLAFSAYNYAIYAFSIHFGPLFLVWTAVLGLSVASTAGLLADRVRSPGGTLVPRSAARLAGWFLVGVAALFALLWLGEIVPDLAAGRPSTSAAAWDVPTNPVHVLDLALFLPAVCASGVLLLRRHPLGDATAPGSLVFLALTGLPILVTPVVALARGEAPGWAVLAPIGAVTAAALAVLWRLLRSLPQG